MEKRKVVLKELQRSAKGKLLHVDFMRVSRKTILKVTVPINSSMKKLSWC